MSGGEGYSITSSARARRGAGSLLLSQRFQPRNNFLPSRFGGVSRWLALIITYLLFACLGATGISIALAACKERIAPADNPQRGSGGIAAALRDITAGPCGSKKLK